MYVLPIPDDVRVHIRRVYAIPAELRALDLAVYLHVLYQEKQSERVQLPAGLGFPDIQDTSYGDRFLGFVGPNGFTTLSTGVFCWLINIRLGYLIFHQGDTYTIELYLPSWFT